ncbi:HYR-like domain-containing protein, partial [Mangrovimonas yunxiaonensis]
MKTSAFKVKSINYLVFVLFFSFNVHLTYSQIIDTGITTEENASPCAVSGDNCGANSVEIHGAYIGFQNGDPVTDCDDINPGDDIYLYIEVAPNGSKHHFFAEFTVEIDGANPIVYHVTRPGPVIYGFYQAGPIPYTCGQEFELKDLLVSWSANASGGPTCPASENYSQCNGDVPNIKVDGPLYPNFVYDQICNTTYDVVFTSTTTGGKIREVGAAPDQLIANPYAYTLDFGDGSPVYNSGFQSSDFVFPTHTYPGVGPYTVTLTVTDTAGTTESVSMQVGPFALPLNITETITNVACNSSNNGAIDIIVSGGTAPYTYNWTASNGGSGIVAGAQNQSGLTAGNYSVTVTDSNGCQNTENYTITVSDSTTPLITAPNDETFDGCSNTDITNGTSSLAYSETAVTISTTDFTNEGGTFTEDNPNTITYQDSASGSCPIVITRTFTITDNCGLTASDTQTFTLNTPDFTISEPSGSETVECLADATESFTLPTVTDGCGNTLTPSNAEITDSPDPITCEGTRTYTYSYTDCNNTTKTWSYVYTIDLTTAPVVPANGSETVECLSEAVQPTAPVVTDACGNDITPTITENNDPSCEGDKVFTFTYEDCAGNQSVYTYTYTLDLTTAPVVPTNGSETVECLSEAVQPTAPVVTDACGNNITPTITENNDPSCEGDKVFTFTYEDCAGNQSVYTYTYTLDLTTAPVVPTNGSETVECLSEAVQPTAPVVTDACGNNITPTITENTDPSCEGDKVFTFTYEDCAGNQSVYTYTYTLDLTTAPVVPANGSETVECLSEAVQPTAPVVTDACGNNITPTITENNDPSCEGDKVFTFTYEDCAGNQSVYTYTYTLDLTTAPVVPANGSETVECLSEAVQPTAPVVTDACGNDITPTITENNDPSCEGDKVFTFTYEDCAGNQSVYTYTYTLDLTTAPVVPANGSETVECLSEAVQPTAPVVTDACGNDITPTITENTDPSCEGDKVFTFTYEDCAGNQSVYTYTYTLDLTTAPVVPANGSETVECLSDAVQP